MPSFVVSAPGKVIIHGEHAVVYGKKALAASLNLRTFMKVVSRNDGKLVIHSPEVGVSGEWYLDELPPFGIGSNAVTDPIPPSPEMLTSMLDFLDVPRETHDTKTLAVAVLLYFYSSICMDGIRSYKGGTDRGLSIFVSSSIPAGAGLGSSAAYSVCLAACLLKIAGVVSQPQIQEHSGLAIWCNEDLDIINKWAFVGEKIIHGNASGIDNSVSCYGGLFKFQRGSLDRLSSVGELNILLTNTKVPRSTRTMVANVASRHRKYPLAVDPILSSIEAISDSTIKLLTVDDPGVNTHDHLEDLIEMNQCLLAGLGVSHPAIDTICNVTAEYGLRSKLTGAGGGGCTITLLKPGHDAQVIEQIRSRLSSLSFDVLQTSLGATGVAEHAGDQLADLPQSVLQFIA